MVYGNKEEKTKGVSFLQDDRLIWCKENHPLYQYKLIFSSCVEDSWNTNTLTITQKENYVIKYLYHLFSEKPFHLHCLSNVHLEVKQCFSSVPRKPKYIYLVTAVKMAGASQPCSLFTLPQLIFPLRGNMKKKHHMLTGVRIENKQVKSSYRLNSLVYLSTTPQVLHRVNSLIGQVGPIFMSHVNIG